MDENRRKACSVYGEATQAVSAREMENAQDIATRRKRERTEAKRVQRWEVFTSEMQA